MYSLYLWFLFPFVFIIFLIFVLRRNLYYQKLIEESVKNKDYGNALLYSKMNGNWWLINYYSEKIEKDFLEMNSNNAISSINALISIGDCKRARRLLFNDARKREDSEILLKWFWEKANIKAE